MLLYKLWKYIFKDVELEIYVEVVQKLCVEEEEESYVHFQLQKEEKFIIGEKC